MILSGTNHVLSVDAMISTSIKMKNFMATAILVWSFWHEKLINSNPRANKVVMISDGNRFSHVSPALAGTPTSKQLGRYGA